MFQYWRLKQFIEERGLIQKFVAQKTGIEEVALSNILNGRQRCSLENYVKLCNFFNVPFDSFIDTVVGDSDTKKNNPFMRAERNLDREGNNRERR